LRDARKFWLIASLVAATLALGACGHAAPRIDGYKSGAVPGITRDRAIAILGKPQQVGPFSLPGTGVEAEVLTYPFGQVLVQNGEVIAVSVNNDPEFRGPFGVTIGMSEDDLYAALAAHPRTRIGHRESYDAIEKTSDTRTKDIYDETDHVTIELTAANANDPMAPFNVAQVTFVNDQGMKLIEAFTKARVAGLYPDVHVDNFVSDPWRGKR
jgi:hypothetical protein